MVGHGGSSAQTQTTFVYTVVVPISTVRQSTIYCFNVRDHKSFIYVQIISVICKQNNVILCKIALPLFSQILHLQYKYSTKMRYI